MFTIQLNRLRALRAATNSVLSLTQPFAVSFLADGAANFAVACAMYRTSQSSIQYWPIAHGCLGQSGLHPRAHAQRELIVNLHSQAETWL